MVLLLETMAVSFRSALLRRRAGLPTRLRPALVVSLLAHVLLAHFALDLILGRERRHGVNDDDVHIAATHQGLDDIKRLLARVRLRNEKLRKLHSDAPGVLRV